jgi:hypothetical protein
MNKPTDNPKTFYKKNFNSKAKQGAERYDKRL